MCGEIRTVDAGGETTEACVAKLAQSVTRHQWRGRGCHRRFKSQLASVADEAEHVGAFQRIATCQRHEWSLWKRRELIQQALCGFWIEFLRISQRLGALAAIRQR